MNLARTLLTAWVLSLGGAALAADAPTAATAAASPELQAIIDKVEKKYAGVETIQASFTQVKQDPFGKISQDGDVVLKRPTKMRWRFTSGDESAFVTDGNTLWIYTKADNQVLRIQDTSQATSTANTFLTSLDSLDELFTISLVEDGGGPTLELMPREQGMYKKIVLSVDTNLVLERVVFTDAYDNVTDLSFRGVKLNGAVDERVFTFTPPPGATLIDN